MDGHLAELVGLVSAQAVCYRISSKQALKTFWFLGLFYFFLFSFVQGLKVFCDLLSISFYKLPLLSIVLFLIFGRGVNGFPSFQKAFRETPDFYLFSSLWISLIWMGSFSSACMPEPVSASISLLHGFFWSFFTALLFPVLAGMKEKLALINPPDEFCGLPVFLIATGLLLLGLVFFIRFNN